ncbi:hypothetical protein [Roseibium sp.]|uniref:hypothetical protein n=1 Tax=Roseibium sp. TaxID=1936156 RepID=UPI003B50CD3A
MTTSRSLRKRGHRSFLRVFSSAFVGLLLASCGPGNQNFLANGPGAQLEANDIAATQIRSEDYFKYLCKQSGILPSYNGKSYSCLPHPGDSRHWMLLTQQGLNDIDRRCDSYLQWLDHKKRSKAPILSQIGAIDTATTAILGATGVSGAPLTIVAAGFGLLRNSVENYHSRLLLEIESSTINSVVLNEQHRFREKLRTDNVVVDNKPAAEHVLRSYLRICLPFSIETSINNFSTLGSKGLQVTDRNSINWSPVVGSAPRQANETAQGNTNSGVGGAQTNQNVVAMFGSDSARSIDDVKAAQRMLCVDDDGDVGPTTKTAIVLYRKSRNANVSNESASAPLDSKDLNYLFQTIHQETKTSNNVSCPDEYLNIGEWKSLRTQTQLTEFKDNYNALADRTQDPQLLERKFNDVPALSSDPGSPLRRAITAAREYLTEEGKLNESFEDGRKDHYTPKLKTEIFKAAQ